MIGSPNPAGAPADHSRRCPGCTTRVPLDQPWCDHCWTRVPFPLAQAVQGYYRRNEAAYAAAVRNARQWLKDHPADTNQPPPSTLAEQLQDMADMLAGIGRHRDHTRQVTGHTTVCSCGVRVQGRPGGTTEPTP